MTVSRSMLHRCCALASIHRALPSPLEDRLGTPRIAHSFLRHLLKNCVRRNLQDGSLRVWGGLEVNQYTDVPAMPTVVKNQIRALGGGVGGSGADGEGQTSEY